MRAVLVAQVCFVRGCSQSCGSARQAWHMATGGCITANTAAVLCGSHLACTGMNMAERSPNLVVQQVPPSSAGSAAKPSIACASPTVLHGQNASQWL